LLGAEKADSFSRFRRSSVGHEPNHSHHPSSGILDHQAFFVAITRNIPRTVEYNTPHNDTHTQCLHAHSRCRSVVWLPLPPSLPPCPVAASRAQHACSKYPLESCLSASPLALSVEGMFYLASLFSFLYSVPRSLLCTFLTFRLLSLPPSPLTFLSRDMD
jgi:hypothetical protein